MLLLPWFSCCRNITVGVILLSWWYHNRVDAIAVIVLLSSSFVVVMTLLLWCFCYRDTFVSIAYYSIVTKISLNLHYCNRLVNNPLPFPFLSICTHWYVHIASYRYLTVVLLFYCLFHLVETNSPVDSNKEEILDYRLSIGGLCGKVRSLNQFICDEFYEIIVCYIKKVV